MLNTMAMSVFERRSEIGSLRAMGCATSRVVRMILGESLLLAAGGAALGVAFGLASLVIMSHWHVTSNLVQGDISYRAIGEGVLTAALMAMVGAAYRLPHRPPTAGRCDERLTLL